MSHHLSFVCQSLSQPTNIIIDGSSISVNTLLLFFLFFFACPTEARLQLEKRRAEETREDGRREDADLREVEHRAVREGQRGDEDGHREADAAEHARRRELALRRIARQLQTEDLAEHEDRAEDADGLAEAETREDAEEDWRRHVKRRERDGDAGIRQREDRHDGVGRPRLERVLELVQERRLRVRGRRDGEAEQHARNRRVDARLQEG